MKVISLLQPWASLVALGEKKIETRSWRTNYRGPLLIHASAGFPKNCKEICMQRPFGNALEAHGYKPEIIEGKVKIGLPTGAIIAKCNLVDCKRIVSCEPFHRMACLEGGPDVFGKEFHFGDYTEGRYAWILDDLEKLKETIPAKGQLGLWEYDYKEPMKLTLCQMTSCLENENGNCRTGLPCNKRMK